MCGIVNYFLGIFDMNIKKFEYFIVIIIFAVSIAGCSGIGTKNDQPPPDSVGSKVEHHGTAKYLDISGMSAKTSNGLLTLQAEITNKDGSDQQGYYRVRWLDGSGISVWNDEPWKPLLLHGNQKLNLKMVSPTKKAQDFVIEFSAKENWRE